ncbi:O-antigen ligase family protein [Alkalibacter saccharofermentans]|uniref:O-antigen ligase like membrane protein n=1 Tax=Alkalibacter saccharofermentans DSM 14828 TaxID=1120975 RepID=A0A1M4WP21_9FIRM|nr:hypothetical protein [Alkalibacter saccharofermentans]SHE83051.1 hypothetical protein SAMN02746064_01306 [Alkalibacter saccharofermentans DSM 14828]
MINKYNSHILLKIIIIEMVLGGSGRVLTITSLLTIRYILFGLSLLYFSYEIYNNNYSIKNTPFYHEVNFFLAVYFMAILIGLFNGYDSLDVINSSKGYLYIFMIYPIGMMISSRELVKKAWEVFNNSALVLALLSIAIFAIFSYDESSYAVINPVLINLEYGHLSIRYGLPSVFFKASPYVAIALINNLFLFFNSPQQRDKFSILKILILLISILSTLTMGIWLASFIGLALCIVLSRPAIKKNTTLVLFSLIIVLIFVFNDFIIDALLNRLSPTDASFIIKKNQFFSLINIWRNNVVVGNGFGIKVFFESAVATREMVKFELFWIELLVNMGLIGLISFLLLIIKPIYKAVKLIKSEVINKTEVRLLQSGIVGLIMFSVISSVNPFLNNPIGLGYLILVMATINTYSKENRYGKAYNEI